MPSEADESVFKKRMSRTVDNCEVMEMGTICGSRDVRLNEGVIQSTSMPVLSKAHRFNNSRHEKSWQSVPNPYMILVLIVYLLILYSVQKIEDELPAPVSREINKDVYRIRCNLFIEAKAICSYHHAANNRSEASMGNVAKRETDIHASEVAGIQLAIIYNHNSRTFSEELAYDCLYDIVGEGPRVAGTKYHLDRTIILKKMLEVISEEAYTPVHVDWQLVSGHYSLSTWAPVNSYQNLSNIVALLEGESFLDVNNTISSILFNCHYDSVPGAMGASDNALFCAAMMEVLARLSKRTRLLKHNIIFLFNGAEENPLQGSHGFLKHKWAKGVISVVNLDSAGMNGKPSLFQVTDPRVLAAYKKSTSRPSAQSIGEMVFKHVPSDTDFRIWRDFGNIYGIDIAFTKWGQVYHTRNDVYNYIQPGVLQNAGDLIMELAEELASSEELLLQETPSSMVYFDYLNTILFTYSYTTAIILDTCILIFGFLSVYYFVWIVGNRTSTIIELLWSAWERLVAMFCGVLVVFVILGVIILAKLQLRYLSNPWIIIPTIWLPYIISTVVISHYNDHQECGLNRSLRSLQASSATRLLLSAVLLVLVLLPGTTNMTYIVSVPLFMTSVAGVVSVTVNKYMRLTANQLLILEMVLSLPSILFMFQQCLRFLSLMVPVMGRSPTNTPDFIITVVNLALVLLTVAQVSGLELLFSDKRLWVPLGPLSVICLVICLTPLAPYNDEILVVQRHVWFHSAILNYDNIKEVSWYRSGVFVSKQDAYTITSVQRAMEAHKYPYNVITNLTDDCDKFLFCNMPLLRINARKDIDQGMFIELRPPKLFKPHPSVTLNETIWDGDNCTLVFYMTGSPHNLLTFWPRTNVSITAWSFSPPLSPELTFKGRPVYVVMHTVPTYSAVIQPLQFNLTCRVPHHLQNNPLIEISHHAHKIQHPESIHEEYLWFSRSMPDYFDIKSIISWRINYVF